MSPIITTNKFNVIKEKKGIFLQQNVYICIHKLADKDDESF